MAFCTACGQRLAGGDCFCGRCGTRIAPGDPTVPAPAGAAAPATPATQATQTLPEVPPAPDAAPDTAVPAAPPPAAPADHQQDPASPHPTMAATISPADPGPRWAPGSGPVPLPPRRPSVRRTLFALGLPAVVIAAGLVGLIILVAFLRSDPDPADAVPKVAAPPARATTTAPPTTTPSTTAPPTASAGFGGGTAGGPAVTGPVPRSSTLPRVTATTALQQAHAIEDLLDTAARTPVTATVASLARCDPTTLDAATTATTLRAAATSRADLLERLDRVPVDRLPDGPALKAALHGTWTQWHAADEHYLTWAQGIVSGAPCNPQDPFKLAGDVAAGAARRAGTDFVARWNTTVARQLRLPARQVRNL